MHLTACGAFLTRAACYCLDNTFSLRNLRSTPSLLITMKSRYSSRRLLKNRFRRSGGAVQQANAYFLSFSYCTESQRTQHNPLNTHLHRHSPCSI